MHVLHEVQVHDSCPPPGYPQVFHKFSTCQPWNRPSCADGWGFFLSKTSPLHTDVTPLQTLLTKVELTWDEWELKRVTSQKIGLSKVAQATVGWQWKHSLDWEKSWRIDALLKTLNWWNGKEWSQILRRFLSKVQAPFCLLASKKWLSNCLSSCS